MRAPSKTISPRVISPFSVLSRPEIDLSVVDLPAPLAAEQRDDRALGHVEAEAAQHQDDVVVDDLEVAHGKERGRGGERGGLGAAVVERFGHAIALRRHRPA